MFFAAVEPNRLLPWVGWNSGQISVLMLSSGDNRFRQNRTFASADPFADVTRIWWERFAAQEDWRAAEKIARVTTDRRPNKYRGWEDLAWALHKQGRTAEAHKILARLLRSLRIPGPPSGRAAYSAACFCGALGKSKEGIRWLRLAYKLSRNRDDFRIQALLEPDLRQIWPGLPELSLEAFNVLE